MTRKFASINHADKFGYAFDSQAFDTRSAINCHFRMFETYGDGLCQHSGDWGITAEYFADYLVSLSVAMLEDEELCQQLYYTLMRRPSVKDIEFCAGIVFSDSGNGYEKKTRFFSVSEKKISSSPAKQYDKRYTQVEAKHNGQAEAIYQMLVPEYAHGLEYYQWAHAIHEWICSQDGLWMELPGRFLKWFQYNDEARELRNAFECACNVVEAYQKRESARLEIENAKRHAERKREQTAAA